MSTELTDISKMPFGKHKGLLMEDVPTDYFHYLWVGGMKKEKTPVANYIRRSLSALQMEYSDGIW